MGTDAVAFLGRVSRQLNDLAGLYWSFAELQDWVNQGQRTMCEWKPDSVVVTEWINLLPGPMQSLPQDRIWLFDVVMNAPQRGGLSVSLVDRSNLPRAWGTESDAAERGVEHWMYLPAARRSFWIYPHYVEAQVGALQCVMGAVAPLVDVYVQEYVEGTPLNPAPTCTVITVSDEDAVMNYCLMRGHLKLTTPASTSRAQYYAQQFLVACGKGREAALIADPHRILKTDGDQV